MRCIFQREFLKQFGITKHHYDNFILPMSHKVAFRLVSKRREVRPGHKMGILYVVKMTYKHNDRYHNPVVREWPRINNEHSDGKGKISGVRIWIRKAFAPYPSCMHGGTHYNHVLPGCKDYRDFKPEGYFNNNYEIMDQWFLDAIRDTAMRNNISEKTCFKVHEIYTTVVRNCFIPGTVENEIFHSTPLSKKISYYCLDFYDKKYFCERFRREKFCRWRINEKKIKMDV